MVALKRLIACTVLLVTATCGPSWAGHAPEPGETYLLTDPVQLRPAPGGDKNEGPLAPAWSEAKILEADHSKGIGWFRVAVVGGQQTGWVSAFGLGEQCQPLALDKRNPHQSLKPCNRCTLKKQVSLMPELNPADPAKSLRLVIDLPAGTQIKVLDVAQQGGVPWYQVLAGQRVGWINSIALMGQFD